VWISGLKESLAQTAAKAKNGGPGAPAK